MSSGFIGNALSLVGHGTSFGTCAGSANTHLGPPGEGTGAGTTGGKGIGKVAGITVGIGKLVGIPVGIGKVVGIPVGIGKVVRIPVVYDWGWGGSERVDGSISVDRNDATLVGVIS